MSRTYTYVGEAEMVVPFTVEGPRVVEAGDKVVLPDTESLDGHPLFVADPANGPLVIPEEPAQAGSETAAPADPPAVPEPVVVPEPPAPVVEVPAPQPEPVAVAEAVPAPADPSAQAAAGQE